MYKLPIILGFSFGCLLAAPGTSHAAFVLQDGTPVVSAGRPTPVAARSAPTPPPPAQAAPAYKPLPLDVFNDLLTAERVARPGNTTKRQPKATTTPAQHFAVAEGFGKQVPLAFATRQIVPFNVDVAFEGNVDTQARVNWQGGRPWNEALRQAIAPLGLKLTASEKKATIRY